MARYANTILLKGDQSRRYEETKASVLIRPGYHMERDGDGLVRPHSIRGGKIQRMIAVEDPLQGKTIADSYAIGDLVRWMHLEPGDRLQGILKAGENVNEGDWLISSGDGTVCKAASAFLGNIAADSTTVTNTVAETTFSNGTITIPKNSLKVGDVIRIRGHVVFPSTNSTDTAAVNIKLGSTTVLAIPATDVANNDVAYFDVTLVVRTVGASGTVIAHAQYSIGVPGTATTRTNVLNSTTLDTTANASITVTVTWSVASASNQAILRSLTVEHVKGGTSSAGGSSGGDIMGNVVTAVDYSASLTDDYVVYEAVF